MEQIAEESFLLVLAYLQHDATALHNLAETAPQVRARVQKWTRHVIYDNLESRPADRFPAAREVRFLHQVPRAMRYPASMTALYMPYEPFVVPPQLPELITLDVRSNNRVNTIYLQKFTSLQNLSTPWQIFRPTFVSLTTGILRMQLGSQTLTSLTVIGLGWDIGRNWPASLEHLTITGTDAVTNLTSLPPKLRTFIAHKRTFAYITPAIFGREFRIWGDLANEHPNWFQKLLDRFDHFTVSDLSFDRTSLTVSAAIWQHIKLTDTRIRSIELCDGGGPVEIPAWIRELIFYEYAPVSIKHGEKFYESAEQELDDLTVIFRTIERPKVTMVKNQITHKEMRITCGTFNCAAPQPGVISVSIVGVIDHIDFPNLLTLCLKSQSINVVDYIRKIFVGCPQLVSLYIDCDIQFVDSHPVAFQFRQSLQYLTMRGARPTVANFMSGGVSILPRGLVTLHVNDLILDDGDAFVASLPRGLAMLTLPDVLLHNPTFPPRIVQLRVRNQILNTLPARLMPSLLVYTQKNNGVWE